MIIGEDWLNYKLIVVYLSFYLINIFGRIRSAYFNFTEILNSCIDDFFLDANLLKRPHRIYKKAIEILNKSKLIIFRTEKILCFNVSKESITLINGSEFIWNYNFENEKENIELINKLRNNKSVRNLKLEIDGESHNKNICYKCVIEKNTYLFILIANPIQSTDISFTPFFNEIITPFFTRLSKVFETFINQKKIELENISEMEDKIAYVNNAISSMHFMRNKLGPIRNYLEMINDFNNEKFETEEIKKKNELKRIIENERNKLNVSLDNILERADSILEKANNPFNVSDVEKYSTLKLYVELRRIWELFIDDVKPFVNLKIDKTLESENLNFHMLGIELVFCNWINNIKKFNAGFYSVILLEDNEFVIINFNNSVHNITDTEEIVKLFNSDDRLEISKRNSHGLIEIKDFLTQMNISSEMFLRDKNILVLNLKFKKTK